MPERPEIWIRAATTNEDQNENQLYLGHIKPPFFSPGLIFALFPVSKNLPPLWPEVQLSPQLVQVNLGRPSDAFPTLYSGCLHLGHGFVLL